MEATADGSDFPEAGAQLSEAGVTLVSPQWPPYDEDPISIPFWKILFRPDLFQFKTHNIDKRGVNGHLKGIKTWVAARSGRAIVFLSAEQEKRRKKKQRWFYFIADGHQRLDTAMRLKLTAQGNPINLSANVLKESDGWTPELAMLFAAYKNIAEDGPTTSALDVAHLLRKMPPHMQVFTNDKEIRDSLPAKNECLHDGVYLSKLGEEAFDLIWSTTAKPEWGVYVAQRFQSDAQVQADVLKTLIETNPRSAPEMVEIIEDTIAAGFYEYEQSDLFGGDDFKRTVRETLVPQRVKIFRATLAALREEKKVMEVAAKPAMGAKLGRGISATDAQRLAIEAHIMELGLKRDARMVGDISTELSAQARRLRNGDVTIGSAVAAITGLLRTKLPEFAQHHEKETAPDDLLRPVAGAKSDPESPPGFI